ncbi:MAG: Rieske 2Fe-2S domain-containing protein [Candidatus Hydrogenedentes bacterium]|nr:Rieske 2Fe-2S domain-containing protein [Candidatus Hydrogenedentota bacterium]
MSAAPHKHWSVRTRYYDAAIVAFIVLSAAAFCATTLTLHPDTPILALALRCSAFMALYLLHVVLCLGPLARLNPRFLALRYDRRHLGVCLFLLALLHAVLAIYQYRGPNAFPLMSLFTAYAAEYRGAFASPERLAQIPFEPFGVLALLCLYVLAASSHDFWQRILGPGVWRLLHLLVYPAYLLVVLHVAFGYLQSEFHLVYPLTIAVGAILLLVLHTAAFLKARKPRIATPDVTPPDGFHTVCRASDLPTGTGLGVRIGGHSIAIFASAGRVYATGALCPHQGGPLAEGQIAEGAITCPWHGARFRLDSGQPLSGSAFPVPVYPVCIREGVVFVQPRPLEPGSEPAGAASMDVPSEEASVPPDFHLGEPGRFPAPLYEFLQMASALFVLGGAALLAAFAAAQSPPDPGMITRGHGRTLDGVLRMDPVPALYVPGPADSTGYRPGYYFPLGGPGLTGIPESWREFDGAFISAEGDFFHRHEVAMLQLKSDAPPMRVEPPAGGVVPTPPRVIGDTSISGELVSLPCSLGSMRPGAGKLHRGCAVRCLAAGTTPGLLVHATGNRSTVVLLAGNGNAPLSFDLALAGARVTVEGLLERYDGFSLLRASSIVPYRPE